MHNSRVLRAAQPLTGDFVFLLVADGAQTGGHRRRDGGPSAVPDVTHTESRS
jgi:hypothetical protein